MAGMCACGRYLSQCVAPHCDRLDPRSGRSEVRKWIVRGEYPNGGKLQFTVLAFDYADAKKKAEACVLYGHRASNGVSQAASQGLRMTKRYEAEESGAVLDTDTGLREWYRCYEDAIKAAAVKNALEDSK